jgi:hypothetical protein
VEEEREAHGRTLFGRDQSFDIRPLTEQRAM